MKKLCYVAWGIIMLFLSVNLNAQEVITQNVRGTISDIDSKQPLVGVTLYVKDSEPIIGTVTDIEGNFTFKDLPIGRHTIVANYLGYETKAIPNVLVGSGKEVYLNVELSESLTQLEEVVVTANKNKGDALNDMSTVSARSFTVEETKRYAGTFNDPARMVSSFAGVTTNPNGQNDIVVRGNSPKGILWRLEGVEIPNPNHFADEGASGGPINALNSAMLDNSDFLTGAFAPEYGNAYSGVFDMKLRKGNSEKREYSLSAGALGFDGTLEGPFTAGYGGSYLINYRYSSLAVLDELGIVNFFGVPKYQDLSFKMHLPAGKAGHFTIFGLGGLSSIYQEDRDEDNEDYVHRTADWNAHMGVVGLNHMVPLSNQVYIKTNLSVSGNGAGGEYSRRNAIGEFFVAGREDTQNDWLRASTCMNYKINAKHRVKGGLTYTNLGYYMFSEYDNLGEGDYTTELDASGRSDLVQSYVNWKYRISDDITLVTGLHHAYFMLNDNMSLEPRLGIKYFSGPKQSFTFGVGMHSKVESLATYTAMVQDEEGNYTMPNKELGLTKALHVVGGYQYNFNRNLRLKGELYYQYLYDVPWENDPSSPYVYGNESSGWTNRALVNGAVGRNYGVELTLERFYNRGFYYLLTGSVYDAKFDSPDGVQRNSSFNGHFAGNILIGKEFKVGDPSKNKTIAINAKVTGFGGGYYTPIDLEKSIEGNAEEYDWSRYNAERAENVFKADINITYRRDRKNTTHEFKIDLQNITNNQAVVGKYYEDRKQIIENEVQWSIFPNIIYTIQF
jgi:hypothetical protein